MISETAFVGCKDLPPEMLGRFDQPWIFLGEHRTGRYSMMAHCGKCNSRHVECRAPRNNVYQPDVTVDLRGHLFITDDMIEVIVYFGVCEGCDTVYWARSGPPFRRARACVAASP